MRSEDRKERRRQKRKQVIRSSWPSRHRQPGTAFAYEGQHVARIAAEQARILAEHTRRRA